MQPPKLSSLLLASAFLMASSNAGSSCLTIITVFSNTESSFTELYANCLVADRSQYKIKYGATTKELVAGSMDMGSYYYVNDHNSRFREFYGSADYQFQYWSRKPNGIEPVVLLHNDVVVDIYGSTTEDGAGTDWDYTNGYAYRRSGVPDGTFKISEWFVSPTGAAGLQQNCAVVPVGTFPRAADYSAPTPCLLITGIVDGTMKNTKTRPRGVELYATCAVPQLSCYALGVRKGDALTTYEKANLGEGSLEQGNFYYASAANLYWGSFFGFPPDFIAYSTLIKQFGTTNTDLLYGGKVIDTYGNPQGEAQTGDDWYFENGYVYRKHGPATPVFEISQWTVRPGVMAGKTKNDGFGAVPFGTFGQNVSVTVENPCLMLTALFDGARVWGTPNGIEVYAYCAVEDLSSYFLGIALDGNPTSHKYYQFPSDAMAAGTFYRVSYWDASWAFEPFEPFFQFPPNATDRVSVIDQIRGTGAVQLYLQEMVVDAYGVTGIDAESTTAWYFKDGFVYRRAGPPNATFDVAQWQVRPGAIEGLKTNYGGCSPLIPLGSYGKVALTPSNETGCLMITAVYHYRQFYLRGVELFALCDVSDLSEYSLGVAKDGSASSTQFVLPSVALANGSYYYVADTTTYHTRFFGFEPDYNAAGLGMDGDDVVELLFKCEVRDVFGQLGVDGAGTPWEYKDGYVYRKPSAPSSTFNISDWDVNKGSFGGQSSNADRWEMPLLPVRTFPRPVEVPNDPSCLMLTAVFDTDGSRARGVELYALCPVPKVNMYALGTSSRNGYNGWDFQLNPGSLQQGEFLYVTARSFDFENFFGFRTAQISDTLFENSEGSDHVTLYFRGRLVDVYGEGTGTSHPGRGTAWAYDDGLAYRRSGLPTTTFNMSEWHMSGVNYLRGVSSNYGGAYVPVGTFPNSNMNFDHTPCLTLTSVFDGPVWSRPRGFELYAHCNVAELSHYGIRTMRGLGVGALEEHLLSGQMQRGQFYYVSQDSSFTSFFGFPPNMTDRVAGTGNMDGDTSVELFYLGRVVDVYGDIHNGGTGSEWEYRDGYAYRNSGSPRGNFTISEWYVSPNNILGGLTSNFHEGLGTRVIPLGSFPNAPPPPAITPPPTTTTSATTNTEVTSTRTTQTGITSTKLKLVSTRTTSTRTTSTKTTSTRTTSTRTTLTRTMSTMTQTTRTTTTTSTTTFPTKVETAEPCLMISAIFDIETLRGLARGVELYSRCAVPNLEEYGLTADLGQSTKLPDVMLPKGVLAKGAYYYVVSQSGETEFSTFFGFEPNVVDKKLVANGDKAVQLFHDGLVIDVYGQVGTDGTGTAWEYTDSFAYRSFGVPNGIFELSDWQVSEVSRLDQKTTNQEDGKNIIPVGTFVADDVPASLSGEVSVQSTGQHAIKHLREQGLKTMTLQSDLGTVSVFSLGKTPAEGSFPVFEAAEKGVKVAMDRSLLEGLGAEDSFMSVLPMKDAGSFEAVTSEKGEVMATTPMDLSVYDKDGQYKPMKLAKKALIKLPDSPSNASGGQQECVYLKRVGKRLIWSKEGVWRATDADVRNAGLDPAGTWCWITHLSIFAVIWKAILGCTNLELLTEDGIAAVTENDRWYKSDPTVLVFCLSAVALSLWLIANAWEFWCFRLGQTYAPGKKVTLCHNVIEANIKLTKHKYTAFVVYIKDVLNCLRTGRHKLRTSSLTSGVQRFLGLRHGISVGCVTQHCWNGGGWIESKAALPKTTLCRKLEFHAGKAEQVMRDDMIGISVFMVVKRFIMTFLAMHPVLDAMRVGPGSMTAAKRTTLQISTFFGVLASNAIIFNFSGEFRSWEAEAECPISPTSQFFIVIATCASILINVCPNGFLTDCAKQVHGRPFWTGFFWAITLVYLSCSILMLVLALANLNPKDERKWYAALEYACFIKFFFIPFLQAIRHAILLEAFLHEDRKLDPSKQFPVFMGLRHPFEVPLEDEAQKEAEQMAKEAISVEELVKFSALLGDKVMLDFDPETSTSEDVMSQAVKPLCIKPPDLGDYPFLVEVTKVSGVPVMSTDELTCSILHLGRQQRQERPCLVERSSTAAKITTQGGARTCEWSFAASMTKLEPEHAVGFAIKELDCVVGIACLTASEVFKEEEQSLSLSLHIAGNRAEGGAPTFEAPEASAPHRAGEITGSGGKAGLPNSINNASLEVKIRLPSGYLQILARHELWKLKKLQPKQESEVAEAGTELQSSIVRAHHNSDVKSNLIRSPSLTTQTTMASGMRSPEGWKSEASGRAGSKATCEIRAKTVDPRAGSKPGNDFSAANSKTSRASGTPSVTGAISVKSQTSVKCGAFCETYLTDFLPPDRMVVHSRQGSFLHLLCTVLADALSSDKEAYHTVQGKILERDFDGIIDMLKEAGCNGTRYWIEMFAIDPSDFDQGGNEGSHWHEDLLPALPTVMRTMRKDSCHKLVDEIYAGKEPNRKGPLTQLLVLDKDCHFMHEKTCLAEMMIAKAMRVRQMMILHPEHLSCSTLGDQLKVLAQQLGIGFNAEDVPWTLNYVSNRQAVYDHVREMVIASVLQKKEDKDSTWEELHLTDVAATIAGMEASRLSGSGALLRQEGEQGGVDDAADDVGADVDVDA